MQKIFLVFLLSNSLFFKSFAQNNGEAILGRWMTTQNNLEVEVYMEDNKFKAKILWFNDEDDAKAPMNSRLDNMNPDTALRKRKLIGMDVLRDLSFNTDSGEWEGGKVYVAKNGKEWDSIAWMPEKNLLKVKGYWLFKFLCQTLTFKRVID